jgi:Rrf2 family protein
VRLEITRRAELAVRALSLLARSPERWKAPALAAELDTTDAFVPQVLGPLVKAGWVRSEPGPTGGYTATAGVGRVSVLEVIEAVDGATDAGRCVVAGRSCDATEPCPLHDAWAQARTELLRTLGSARLADLAAP